MGLTQNPKVYMDYASTAPLSKSVWGKLNSLGANWHNPSSSYAAGAYNKFVLSEVRKKFAESINAKPDEIIFTSSGSEANALAIDGFLKANVGCKECHCSNIEHASIIENPNCIADIKVNKEGIVDLEAVPLCRSFCSVMMCNNEIGTYQPIASVGDIVHYYDGVLHVDAVQAYGKIRIDVKELNVDMMSFSGHKIGSLRGVGVLYVKKGIKLSPIIYGTQEQHLRGGTYNDLAIKTLGLAIDDIDYDLDPIVRNKRNYLLERLLKIPNVRLNGTMTGRNSSNINILVKNIGIDSQQMVGILDENGFMVSGGSACHSYSKEPSHVLKAIGLSDEEANHSLRITLGADIPIEQLKQFVETFENMIKMFGK